MKKEIKATATLIHSKRDDAGNVYWYFTYFDYATEKTVRGKITGGERNITAAFYELHGDHGYVDYWIRSCGIRPFDKETKNMPYAGCVSKDIAEFIKKELAKE